MDLQDTSVAEYAYIYSVCTYMHGRLECKKLISDPLILSQAIHDTLPFKAKMIMERLISVSQDAVFKLESEPVSTVDFVNLLK